MVDDGIVGVTSNPTIFQKAIAGSSDYDERSTRCAVAARRPPTCSSSWRSRTCRRRPTRSAPCTTTPATSTASSRSSCRPAWPTTPPSRSRRRPSSGSRIDRPNMFIKIPGTAEGVPAIEESIAAGINVNVTLLFSLAAYDAIHEAYIRGLERRVEAGPADRRRALGGELLRLPGRHRGRQASCPRARRCGAGRRSPTPSSPTSASWPSGRRSLGGAGRQGAQVQRPLWASTGTKNPAYSDVLYVDSLIGPDTRQHHARGHDRGVPGSRHRGPHGRRRRRRGQGRARRVAAAGSRIDEVTRQLELDGVKSFSDSFNSLVETIQERLDQIGTRGAA